jgi:hypothetical protein
VSHVLQCWSRKSQDGRVVNPVVWHTKVQDSRAQRRGGNPASAYLCLLAYLATVRHNLLPVYISMHVLAIFWL